jgi:hypothetical protein
MLWETNHYWKKKHGMIPYTIIDIHRSCACEYHQKWKLDVTANIARVEWSPSHMRSSTAPTIAKGIAVCMVRKSLLRTMPTCQLLFRNFQTQPYDGETGFPISSTPPLVVNSGHL